MLEWIEANPGAAAFWAVCAGFGAVLAAKVFALVFMRGQTVHMIGDAMKGSRGEVSEWTGSEGLVSVGGELWKARSKDPLSPGATVSVMRVEGLYLDVKAAP